MRVPSQSPFGDWEGAPPSVFFPREHRKNAREHLCKFAREHLCFARELSKKNLPVNPRKCPWTPKKCPWILKVPVNIFTKIAELGRSRALFLCSRALFFNFYGKTARELQNVPVNISKFYARELLKSARENVQKSARERNHWPVNLRHKVPVNAKMCPWRSSENWGSRALLRFTGKKKTSTL